METITFLAIFISTLVVQWHFFALRKQLIKEIEDIKIEIRLIKKMLLSDRIVLKQIEQCVNDIEDKLNEGKVDNIP